MSALTVSIVKLFSFHLSVTREITLQESWEHIASTNYYSSTTFCAYVMSINEDMLQYTK